jgi:hypothetical protein
VKKSVVAALFLALALSSTSAMAADSFQRERVLHPIIRRVVRVIKAVLKPSTTEENQAKPGPPIP